MAKKKRELKYSSPKKAAEQHKSGFTMTQIKIPDGMKRWRPEKEGTYRIDIIPYIVGKLNQKAEEGTLHYECTYQVHARIGAEENSYACLKRYFGKKCPICEQRVVLGRDPEADDDAIKALMVKDRQLFLIIDHADREAGVQLWEASYHLFGKLLETKLKNADDDEYENFHSLTDGMSLRITFEERSLGKNSPSFLDAKDIEFKKRKEQYEEDLLDDLPCLDELPIEMDYDKLREIMLQLGDDKDKDEDEPTPKKGAGKKSKPKPADDDDDDDDEDDDDEPAPKKKSKPKPADDDDDEDEDEDDEPAPKKGAGKKSKPADDEDEDEDEDEDDEPAPKAKGKGKASGFKVGDKVKHEEHGKCEIVHVSKEGDSYRIKDSEGETHYGIDADELTIIGGSSKAKPADDDDDEDEPAPKAKGKKSKPAPADDDDDEDEDDDEDDDEPAPKSKSKSKKKDEDEDEDDIPFDDDDDEPAPKKKKGAGKK